MQNIGGAVASIDAHIRMILLMLTFKVTGFDAKILKERSASADSIAPNAKSIGDPPMLILDMDKAVSGARPGLCPVVFG